MITNKKSATIIKEAIYNWQKNGLLSSQQTEMLLKDITIATFNWKLLAKYAFWISIICFIISVTAMFADERFLKFINIIFNSSSVSKCGFLSIVAALIFYYGIRRKKLNPEKIYSNEIILFLGVLTTASAAFYLGDFLEKYTHNLAPIMLLLFAIFALLGYLFKSNLIWLFAILYLGGWMGAQTGYLSGWGSYYLGFNYPIRFALFGILLTLIALSLEHYKQFASLYKCTLVMGLLYLFISLWIMSIFGNYGDLDAWYQAKQIELFHWSILFAVVAGIAILYGLKYHNDIIKNFGITFLFINLYTRFFEYFWLPTNKAIFFAILAVSFWLIGSKAEKIYNLGNSKLEN